MVWSFAGTGTTMMVRTRTGFAVCFGAMITLTMLWATTILGPVLAIATGEAAKRRAILG